MQHLVTPIQSILNIVYIMRDVFACIPVFTINSELRFQAKKLEKRKSRNN